MAHSSPTSKEEIPVSFARCDYQKIAWVATQYRPASQSEVSTPILPPILHNDPLFRPQSYQGVPADSVWIATEKIHGAQLQIYCQLNGTELHLGVAKRTEFLDFARSTFFGFQEVVELHRGRILKLMQHLVRLGHDSSCPELSHIVLIGELFGGAYPSEAAPSVNDPSSRQNLGKKKSEGVAHQSMRMMASPENVVAPVQEGVMYSPLYEFALFDAGIVFHQLPSSKCEPFASSRGYTTAYLPLSRVRDLARQFGFFVPPLISIGTFCSVDSASAVFESQVPHALNVHHAAVKTDGWTPLHVLPRGTNFAEGLVIRPDSSEQNVLLKGQPARSMFKKKHPKFEEIEAIETQMTTEPPLLRLKRLLLFNFCTSNRIASAISKIGPPLPTDGPNEGTTHDVPQRGDGDGARIPAAGYVAQLASFLISDMFEDFWLFAPAEYHGLYAQLAEIDTLNVQLQSGVEDLVRNFFQSHSPLHACN